MSSGYFQMFPQGGLRGVSPGAGLAGVAAVTVLGAGVTAGLVALTPGMVALTPGVVALIPGVTREVAPVPGAGARSLAWVQEVPSKRCRGAVVPLCPRAPGCPPLPRMGQMGRGPGFHHKLASKVFSGFAELKPQMAAVACK